MTVKAKLQERLGTEPRPLTRRVDRQTARGEIIVQSAHGHSAAARLNDISIYGCNILAEADWMRCGMFVSIRLSADRSIQAIVRWIRDGSCGVEFLRAIPGAEADALAAHGA
ncbi:PilZ domain-containing protein [Novosphingobium kunmingense]|uniref:PilZ domain-containing protein n=1 Tax=Novosphingobium kunmingense TaxID=1211806 RepID=A0A2N0I399_9SPHN|nr:PilZ domain-containing protein [Novosphingobium kunmingense]PKB25640.1 PilZ domain-containing protein [Novosphingobium kunmingense]